MESQTEATPWQRLFFASAALLAASLGWLELPTPTSSEPLAIAANVVFFAGLCAGLLYVGRLTGRLLAEAAQA